MSAQYPNALATTAQLKDDAVDATVMAVTHATAHNNVADEIVAIETELGTNPKGTYTDVKTRLNDVVVKTPSASQTITLSGDYVGLAVKANAVQNLKNLIEAQNSSGVILAYFDKDGIVNAVGFKVAGTALASTHLTDTAQLARLASPALTGTPTAPTPTAGDSSTKLATTAFVQALAAASIPSGTILPYGGSSAPTGFLMVDGSVYAQATYPNLYAKIGDQYNTGGEGGGNFRVPDMQGRMPVGLAGGSGHSDVQTLGNNEGLTVGSRRPKHSHGLGTLVVGVSAHSINDGGHTHTITDSGHVHTTSNDSHSHTKTDPGHTHTASGGSHSHTASGSSGPISANHTHTYSQPTAATAAGQTGGSQYFGTNTTGTSGINSADHSHSISVTVNSATPSISADLGVTGITYASATTGVTIDSATTGISVNNHTTGISINDHVVTPSGNVGTTSTAPVESPAYLVLNFIIKT